MFLRNYDNYWTALNSTAFFSEATSYEGNSTTQWGDGYYNLKTPSGALQVIYYTDGYYYNPSYGTTYGWYNLYTPACLSPYTICLGTGDVPVDYEDYKLSGSVVSLTLTTQKSSTTYNAETGKWKRSITCTCPNLGTEDVVIREWGIYKWNTDFSTTGQNTSGTVTYSNSSSQVGLMYREVLTTPITIKAGTTSTITFSIEIPLPNHP